MHLWLLEENLVQRERESHETTILLFKKAVQCMRRYWRDWLWSAGNVFSARITRSVFKVPGNDVCLRLCAKKEWKQLFFYMWFLEWCKFVSWRFANGVLPDIFPVLECSFSNVSCKGIGYGFLNSVDCQCFATLNASKCSAIIATFRWILFYNIF